MARKKIRFDRKNFTDTVEAVLKNAEERGIEYTKTSKRKKDAWVGDYTTVNIKFPRCAELEVTEFHGIGKSCYRRSSTIYLRKYSAITNFYNYKTSNIEDIVKEFKKCKYYTPQKAAETKAKNDAKHWKLVTKFGRLLDRENHIYDYTLELYKLGRDSSLSDPKTKIKLKANIWTTNMGFMKGIVIDLDKKTMTSLSKGELQFNNKNEILRSMTEMIKSV